MSRLTASMRSVPDGPALETGDAHAPSDPQAYCVNRSDFYPDPSADNGVKQLDNPQSGAGYAYATTWAFNRNRNAKSRVETIVAPAIVGAGGLFMMSRGRAGRLRGNVWPTCLLGETN